LAILATLTPADVNHTGNEGDAVSKTVHKIPFSRLTSIGKNWQLKTLLVRFLSSRCKADKVYFAQSGVVNTHFIEGIEKLAKMPQNGLANRRLQPLGHLSAFNNDATIPIDR